MSKFDGVLGVVGIAAGLVGVGYGICMHSKMAKVSENLDRSLDELAEKMPVDIPEGMVARAVEKAVNSQIKETVTKATDSIISDVKLDVRKKVNDAVESEYANIKSTVLTELTNEAAKIDAKRVRADVEKAAKEHALEKFDSNLDDILENFNEQLKSTSKIYTSIADTMTGYKTSGRETVLRIG